MKKIVCIVLAMMLAFASFALAEGANVSITTGRPTEKGATTMVVQMDNEPSARPQKGIASADVVYEIELYKGGYTRYTAVFNDNIPDQIEAIRSARIVNADIYADYNGAFVHFGGQKYEGSNVYEYFNTLSIGARYDGITGMREFYRDSSRSAPNNVVCKLRELYDKTDWASITCRSPLKFKAAAEVPAGEDVVNFAVNYRDGKYSPSYIWDPAAFKYNRYYNGNPYVDGLTGEQVTCDNVIVQSVEYGWYNKKGDAPRVTTVGTGRCEYFIGGKHFSGSWRRDSIDQNTVYLDEAGNEVYFNPGVTFIQILTSEKSVDILG